ncbi:MAG TPA: PP2C family serine/threonine-protein phosphatase [Terracidiphilus sp.]|nr:PP2C family serine/threonine-protein phosphatase [Terracidiphilus sp.]
MAWKVAHACVRGSSHVRSGLPNQDAAQCVINGPGMAIVAVSDGHGGARHFRSQIGSSLAASTAVSVLEEFLPRHATADAAAALTSAEIEALERTLVETWLASVHSDLANQPLSEEELARFDDDDPEVRASVEQSPTLAYGATLLIAAATENLLLYLQLGDGEILSVSADGETERPLPPDERLVGNQTTSLCQPEAWKEFRSAHVVAPNLPSVVLLSTDGYSNSFRSDEDFLKIGRDYLEILREQGINTLAEELPQILQEATQQGSGDDITLAILQGDLRRGAEPERGPVKPAVSEESRSALITQLKARHSSQNRKVDELAAKLEESHRIMHRLRLLLIVLLLAVAGGGVYYFRDRLFAPSYSDAPHSGAPGPKSKGIVPDSKPGAGSLPVLPNHPAQKNTMRWQLAIHDGDTVTLEKGVKLQASDVLPDGDDNKPYAEVAAESEGKMILINRSDDTWKVQPSSGDAFTVVPGHHILLGKLTDAITFRKKVSGTIAPVDESPTPPPSKPASTSTPAAGDQPKGMTL